MIPLELFNGPEMETRRKNAFAKAEKEKPVVTRLADGPRTEFYSVNQYVVQILTDLDQQRFIECNCAAGSPPIDPETELPAREAQPCYHSAATLLHIERESNASSNDRH